MTATAIVATIETLEAGAGLSYAFPAEFAQQPGPDPAIFGMPAEDDGSRTDPLLGLALVGFIEYEPDFAAEG